MAALICLTAAGTGVGPGFLPATTHAGAAAAGAAIPAPTEPENDAYALVDAAGGLLTFGGAGYWGDTLDITLHKPIVGGTADPAGGYWLVASDGGVFSFGAAQFHGSTGGLALNKPIVGMATTGDGGGYWLVASDGGIFTFGNAPFLGSMGGATLSAPIAGMAATPGGGGYWLVGQDAGVFNFGDAQFAGSAQSPLHPPLFPVGFSAAIPPVVTIMTDPPGPQAAHQGRLRVAFAGDSLGFYEGQYTLGTNPPYSIDDGAAPGCGYTNGAPLIPWSDPNTVFLSPTACTLWAQQLQWVTSRFHPDVTVIQLGYWEAQYRQFEGSYVTLGTTAYANYIQDNLAQAVQIAHSDGGAVILNTSPYFNDGTPAELVNDFNQIIKNVASEFSSFVTIFNVGSMLDPNGSFTASVNGVLARTPDGVHVTEAGVSAILVPPLNQLINTVAGPVYQGKQ